MRTSVSPTGSRRRLRRRLFLAYPIDNALPREVARRRSSDPGALRADPAGGRARDLRAAAGWARCSASSARSPARARSTSSPSTRGGRPGRRFSTSPGERDYASVRKRVSARRLPRARHRPIASAPRSRPCDLVLARSGLVGLGDRRCGTSAILVPYPFATGDHQALNAEHFVRAGGAIMVRELDLDDVPELVRSLLDDPARRQRMSEAMLRGRTARRGRRDRRRADRSGPAVSAPFAGRRLWFVGIGGAGLSAYAQLARAWGAEVGGWDRVDTPYLDPLRGRRARDHARARRSRRLGAGRLVGVSGGRRACAAPSSCASSSRPGPRSSSAARMARARPPR